MVLNKWLDLHFDSLQSKKLRVINKRTNKAVGENLFAYVDNEVIESKITSRFVFIYIV